MDQARDFFGSWSDAWHAWLVAAGAGGSVVLAAAQQGDVPDATPCAMIAALDAAREAAFAAHPDGGATFLALGSMPFLGLNPARSITS